MIRVFIRPCGKTYKEEHKAAYELLYAAASLMGVRGGKVAKTEQGKPYFADDNGTFFSIAHGGGYAAVAIGERPCGIDIEKNRPLKAALRKKYLSGASEDEAVVRWTERESLGKLLGGGFFDTESERPVAFTHYIHDGMVLTVCAYEGTAVSETVEMLREGTK